MHPPSTADDVLFIFLDESGNFDFSPKGSKYWSLTAVCTARPVEGRETLISLLYELAAAGGGQEFFHATEDLQSVRDQVFARINALPRNFEIHSVIAEKCKTNPSIYTETSWKNGKILKTTNPDGLYEIVCRTLLKYIFRSPKYQGMKRIVVIISAIFNGPRHKAIKRVLGSYLKKHTNVPFFIHFHSTKADMNCQMADYCGWAIGIKWERKETRSYDLIKDHIKSEFAIFEVGITKYY